MAKQLTRDYFRIEDAEECAPGSFATAFTRGSASTTTASPFLPVGMCTVSSHEHAQPDAEIEIATNFSFLRGGSDPRAYVHQASILGIPAIGIADHNTLAGVVRAYKELDNDKVLHKPKLLIGTRIVFIDGTPRYPGLSARPRRLWPAVPASHQGQARRQHRRGS